MIFVKRSYLVDALTKACKIATDNDTRYYANGVWFDAQPGLLKIVASDALSLYLAEIPCHVDESCSILVERKALSKMLRVIKASSAEYAEIEAQEDSFKIDGYSSPIIPGNYPPYEQSLPQRPFSFGGKIDAKLWLASLKVLGKVTDKNDIFTLNGDTGTAFTLGVCEATAPLPWIGSTPSPFIEQGLTLNYNLPLLRTILSMCGGKADLDWEQPTRPMQLTPCDRKFPELFLLVPTRY